MSGGSFAAAYLGLFGADAFISDFPEAVLYRNLERGILLRLALPWNWVRLLSPRFSRSDVADRVLRRRDLRGEEFKDLPRRRPFIVLNATDIAEGAQLSFTQDQLDRLCSELEPHARRPRRDGVLGVPGGLPARDAHELPEDLRLQAARRGWTTLRAIPTTNPPGHALAPTWLSYEKPERRYIHLSDGGLADNIGLRAPYHALEVNQWDLADRINTHEITPPRRDHRRRQTQRAIPRSTAARGPPGG